MASGHPRTPAEGDGRRVTPLGKPSTACTQRIWLAHSGCTSRAHCLRMPLADACGTLDLSSVSQRPAHSHNATRQTVWAKPTTKLPKGTPPRARGRRLLKCDFTSMYPWFESVDSVEEVVQRQPVPRQDPGDGTARSQRTTASAHEAVVCSTAPSGIFGCRRSEATAWFTTDPPELTAGDARILIQAVDISINSQEETRQHPRITAHAKSVPSFAYNGNLC